MSSINPLIILKDIQREAGQKVIYDFLIAHLEDEIASHSKNNLYWANQVGWIKKFSKSKHKKKDIKTYQSFISKNSKTIKRFKKAQRHLKKALKQGDSP